MQCEHAQQVATKTEKALMVSRRGGFLELTFLKLLSQTPCCEFSSLVQRSDFQLHFNELQKKRELTDKAEDRRSSGTLFVLQSLVMTSTDRHGHQCLRIYLQIRGFALVEARHGTIVVSEELHTKSGKDNR